MTKNLDFLVLSNYPEKPRDQMASAIAKVLWTGEPSLIFCRMLADMIDPGQVNKPPYVLKIQRRGRGNPKGTNLAVALEMERLRDDEGVTTDVAVAEIQRMFGKKGNSRAACLAALAEVRRIRALEASEFATTPE
jgi:hypothetical protein